MHQRSARSGLRFPVSLEQCEGRWNECGVEHSFRRKRARHEVRSRFPRAFYSPSAINRSRPSCSVRQRGWIYSPSREAMQRYIRNLHCCRTGERRLLHALKTPWALNGSISPKRGPKRFNLRPRIRRLEQNSAGQLHGAGNFWNDLSLGGRSTVVLNRTGLPVEAAV
jgi:hypothetical protein